MSLIQSDHQNNRCVNESLWKKIHLIYRFLPNRIYFPRQRRLHAVLRYSINGVCQIILLFSFQCNWTRLICCLSVSLQPKLTCWLMSADFSNLETDRVACWEHAVPFNSEAELVDEITNDQVHSSKVDR